MTDISQDMRLEKLSLDELMTNLPDLLLSGDQDGDILFTKSVAAKLVKMAFYDPQTNLPNRHYFLEELEKELRKVRENPSYTFCVIFISIDKSKLVNEQLSPHDADELIVKVAKRVSSIIEGFASTFRMSGDEFFIIVRGTNSKVYINSQLQRIRRLISNPALIGGKSVFLSATFGAVLDIQGSNTASQIIAFAVDAVVTGKKSDMGTINFISAVEEMEALVQRSESILRAARTDISRGLADSEFLPHFQPIYQLSPSRLAGFEALARWTHPNGLLIPDAFVRQAEETGLITEIDKNVISKTLKTAKQWAQTYPEFPFFVSANASGASLMEPRFVPFILERLEKIELDPKYFVLEVTEGIFIENFENTAAKLNVLQEHGIKVALDDFGTGYSSLQYVNRLPLSYIKIDKSFIDQLFSSKKAMLMVRSIINMAGILGIGVVAEGVETVQQLDWLTEEHKDAKVQGYFFSAPLPPEEAEHFLADANAFYSVTKG